jgi:streptogramin lyase
MLAVACGVESPSWTVISGFARASPVTEGAAGVRDGLGSVWVSNPEADIVEQIDLKRLKVANKITTGDRPRYMAIGAGSIWALAQVDGSITRYTPATKETIRIEAGLPGAGGDMTFGAGSVWARGAGDRLLIRLDPAPNQVVSEYGPAFGAGAVAVGHGAVWISAYNEKKAWRLPLAE